MGRGGWGDVWGWGCGREGRGEGTYDLKSVVHDAHGHQLLAVVAPVHHQRVGQALDDGALGLAEALHGVAAGGVGDVDGGADLDVISVFGACMLAAAAAAGPVERRRRHGWLEGWR